MIRILIVAVGGASGSVTRYLLGGWAAARWGTAFPYGTMLINVTGSFLLGLVGVLTTERFSAPQVRLLLGVGFMGGYTTFSTFQYESLQLLAQGSYARAALNMGGSLALGLIGVWLGVVAARLL